MVDFGSECVKINNWCLTKDAGRQAISWYKDYIHDLKYLTKQKITVFSLFDVSFLLSAGARGGAVVEALRYKPEGRGIDSRWCNWNFSLT
jgi:spore maturation protein CgeB